MSTNFSAVNFFNFWSLKPWTRIESGSESGSVFSLKCWIRIRYLWIRIRNTGMVPSRPVKYTYFITKKFLDTVLEVWFRFCYYVTSLHSSWKLEFLFWFIGIVRNKMLTERSIIYVKPGHRTTVLDLPASGTVHHIYNLCQAYVRHCNRLWWQGTGYSFFHCPVLSLRKSQHSLVITVCILIIYPVIIILRFCRKKYVLCGQVLGRETERTWSSPRMRTLKTGRRKERGMRGRETAPCASPRRLCQMMNRRSQSPSPGEHFLLQHLLRYFSTCYFSTGVL